MKATFLKDEYNNLWFFYAKDVKIRSCSAKIEEQQISEKLDYFNIQTRENIMKELEEFGTK
jgi:hypothetical protein